MERTDCLYPGYSTFTKIKQIYKFETLGLLNSFDHDEVVDEFIFFMSLCSCISRKEEGKEEEEGVAAKGTTSKKKRRMLSQKKE